MSAFSVALEGFVEDREMVAGEGDDRCLKFGKELVQPGGAGRADFDGKNHLGFGHGWGADHDRAREGEFMNERLPAGFGADNCHDGGGIEDQTGSPDSP